MTRIPPDDDLYAGGQASAMKPLSRTAATNPPGARMRFSGATDGTDEAFLVRQAQHGDHAAFETLVRATARMLYARLYLETGDRQRTEDLVQETYLIAWRSIDQLHELPDASGFRRWLFSIARTVRIDAGRHDLRKKRGRDRVIGGGDGEAGVLAAVRDPGLSPAEQSEQRETHDRLLGLLRVLPEEYRAPISMRYLAGADYATVCKQLGLSNGSLRGLLSRGMNRLRQLMSASEEY
ncbi:RNA polymerase sigma factor [Humisphaera borealis]|uniref:Sigma-70 family RNA polymerase sigma factor n=1 Tax=Humisphaera borealis TaxID=2807512 RepID=A0A7M2WWZ0_9BACT|nr:sigma-70 family RNA polymerase sigma factor [Humisphaera borealis]QOV90048.1 sigma-70 family RNA polymerase sigma factor [Humisphaera borealis]